MNLPKKNRYPLGKDVTFWYLVQNNYTPRKHQKTSEKDQCYEMV